ncbi:MAG: amidohydrolase family protein [Planctomycetota bacterium]
MKCLRFSLAALALATSISRSSAQVPAPAQQEPIALAGGTVHPVSGDPVQDATLLFENGKIRALGKSVELPAGVRRIDVSGKHVYPGLIDAHTILGLVEINALRATRDFSEVGEIKSEVRAEVSVNPDSELLPVTRANGVLLALSIPQGGLISGRSALLQLDGWTWEDLSLKAPVGLHVRWPSMTMRGRRGRRGPEAPAAERRKRRDAQIEKIKEAFADARAYKKAKDAQGVEGVPELRADLRLEAMLPAIEKRMPVFVHADELRQIQAAMDFAAEEDLRVVIVGGQDAWRVAGELRELEIPVVLAGVHRLPRRRFEAYDTPFTTPNKLFEAGVEYCIAGPGGSFGASNARNLPYHAATAAAYGLPRSETLKAITLHAARILGVSDRVGTLEVGKDATLIVTTGDPLEITTKVEAAFIQGREIDLDSRHERLFRKYSEKFRQLGLGNRK